MCIHNYFGLYHSKERFRWCHFTSYQQALSVVTVVGIVNTDNLYFCPLVTVVYVVLAQINQMSLR